MISGYQLWFVFAGLYILESIRVAGPGVVRFRRYPWARAWRWSRRLSEASQTGRNVWTLASLWPGGAPDLMVQGPVIAWSADYISPNALFVGGAGHATALDGIRETRVSDSDLLVDGAQFLRFQSSAGARWALRQLDCLRALPRPEREAAIVANIERGFSLSSGERSSRERLRGFEAATRTVSSLATGLWFAIFAVLPAGLAVTKSDLALLPVGALIWTLALAIFIAGIGAKKRTVTPENYRFPWASLKYIFYPVAALRVCDDLAEGLFADLHPAAVCIAICEGDGRSEFLKDMLLRMLYPVSLSAVEDASSVETNAWFNRAVTERLRAEITRAAPKVSLIPTRLAGTSVTYCPRCHAEYQTPDGECADCPGIRLKEWK